MRESPESAIPGVPYCDFSLFPGNYDCTNFVSHALFKGGATMNDKGGYGLAGDDQWYFRDDGNRSYSWSGVPNLYTFLTRAEIDDSCPGPSGEEKPKIYAEVGDVLQFYYYDIGRWRHSAIITEVSGGDIWYSSRSSTYAEYNRYNEILIDSGHYETRVIHMLGNSTGM